MTTFLTSTVIEQYVYGRTTRDILHWCGTERGVPPLEVECSCCDDTYTLLGNEIVARSNSQMSSFYQSQSDNFDPHELVEQGSSVWLCDSCDDQHSYCDDCSTLTHNDDLTSVTWSSSVCENCREDTYSWCDSHDGYYHNSEGCSSCDEDEYESDTLINDYSYRPSPTFFLGGSRVSCNEPKHVSVTGFELEMEAVECSVSEGAELANELYQESCYLKHDGSLSDGFEMVSHPLTRAYIDSVFNFDGLKELSKLGMRSAQTRTCGLHVHINRGFFTGRETSFYRFLSMFNNNSDQWRKLAGRSTSTYSRWTDEETENMFKYTRGLSKERTTGSRSINNDRYVAINMQPRETVELRFFKGTLRPSTMKARVEAVHAVAEFSIATRNNINIKASSDWDKFRQFAETNGYKAFSEYATEKGV